ncbi:MAG TPA: glycosyltransferase family 39 protein [Candidatus Binatia bacterium]|nr:glycosyltransferase family 39 protein [Candidatus Binatia bacterium]
MIAASGAVALLAIAARVHDVAAYPPLHDWDASGHAVNVVDLHDLHLPDPRSWCGSHPPLYYAIGAALWRVLPASVPVHVTLRLVSVAAWIATVGLVWRWLRRVASESDAAVVAALLLGVPGFVIASCMMTNDALCTLFIIATVLRLAEAPRTDSLPARHAAVTGILTALAAITKATGIVAAAMAAAFYAWRSRRRPACALRNVFVVAGLTAAIAGPHYARLLLSLPGSPYDILAGRVAREKAVISDVVVAASPASAHFPSYAGLLHSAMWGDPTGAYMPRDTGMPTRAMWLAGFVVTAVVAAGAVRLFAKPDLLRAAGLALVFGMLYVAVLLPHVSTGPYVGLTKTNYMMPEVLPLAVLAVVGMGTVGGKPASALRAILLAIAAGGVAFTWFGWWTPAHRAARPPAAASVDGPRDAVSRYFDDRAFDPIRALHVLAPDVQLAHELRLARILRLPLAPEEGLTAAEEHSLELARARVAWLELYNLVEWMQPIATGLAPTVVDADGRGDVADVRVRVEATGALPPNGAAGVGRWPFPAFEQHFALRREGHDWRITGIRQDGVLDDNAVDAFVAYPTLAGLEHLRALGWHPSWELPVAAVTGRAR